MIKTRFGYTLLLGALLPFALIRLVWRARRQPAYLRHLSERFGFYGERPSRPIIWLHAVSVGETRAAEPLINALRREHPNHRVLITHITPTGRETGAARYGDDVLRCYLPYDFPFAIRGFLDHFRPEIGALIETEIWFNLIHECRTRGTPIYLVNARLSQRSAAKYARFPDVVRNGLQQLTGIAAQTNEDARRLESLGAADVHVCGNLKFDIDPPAENLALGRQWRTSYGARPVLLAASTRDGEEALLLDALVAPPRPNSLPHDLLFVIVPRHPQRFDAVAALLEKRGVRYRRRSENGAIAADTQVLLGDSMGELFAYYAACDIAFIGGSLLPFGGQNLIEACVVGRPVIVGPHTYNFLGAADAALEAGAALQVDNAEQIFSTAASLFADEARMPAMGEAGRKFAAEHRGATAKLMALMRW